MNLHDTNEHPERVILAGVHTGCRNELEDCTEESMKELELLAQTAGAEASPSPWKKKENLPC